MKNKIPVVVIRGGGDLASGVALRLYRAGIKVLVTECEKPLMVRRLVSFGAAVFQGQIMVEGVTGRKAEGIQSARDLILNGQIPVLVDPDLRLLRDAADAPLQVRALVDARMTKRGPDFVIPPVPLAIGLGPGFTAGENCDVVIETHRGHALGRVIWHGEAEADTGIPGKVKEKQGTRVLRAPVDGQFRTHVEIGCRVEGGQLIAEIAEIPVKAPFDGVVRGLLYPGLTVARGLKVGDVDPREDPTYARLVSDKALAVGGGVLEALLTKPEIRARLWI